MSDPLNDLQSLLNKVEPSVGFSAQVRAKTRARIGEQSPVRASWIPALAAAALVVAVVVVVQNRRPANQAALRTESQATLGTDTQAAPQENRRPAEQAVLRTEEQAALRTGTTPQLKRVVFRSEVTAVAERDQDIAIRRLLFILQTEPDAVPAESVASPIEIAPITVKPLVTSGTERSGGREK